MNKRIIKIISNVLLVLVIVLTCLLSIKNIFYFEIEVVGSSMVTTLNEGEIGLASKITYVKEIERNDIIIFKRDNKEIIKRVIGKPLDKIGINENGVYVNNQLIEESYLTKENKEETYFLFGTYNEITLKEDEYFVLGDNRRDSLDSRSYGPIKEENIVGKLVVIYPSKDNSTKWF